MPSHSRFFSTSGVRSLRSALKALAQVRRNIVLAHAAGIGARSVEEGSAGAPGAIHQVFRQVLEVVAVVIVLVADHVDQARPSAAQADDLIVFADRPYGDRPDCRVQSRYIAAAGENANHASLTATACHDDPVLPLLRISARLV